MLLRSSHPALVFAFALALSAGCGSGESTNYRNHSSSSTDAIAVTMLDRLQGTNGSAGQLRTTSIAQPLSQASSPTTQTAATAPLHVGLQLPTTSFSPGALFYLDLGIDNPSGNNYPNTTAHIVLTIGATHYFYPHWTTDPSENGISLNINQPQLVIEAINDFTWPSGIGNGSASFTSALLNHHGKLLSNVATVAFSWTDDDRPQVLCAGDSVTGGYGASEFWSAAGGLAGYPADLQNLMPHRQIVLQRDNTWFGGGSSWTIREGLASALSTYPRPRYVLILAGVIDVVQGLPLQDTRNHLEQMVHLTRQYHGPNGDLDVIPIIATIPPFNPASIDTHLPGFDCQAMSGGHPPGTPEYQTCMQNAYDILMNRAQTLNAAILELSTALSPPVQVVDLYQSFMAEAGGISGLPATGFYCGGYCAAAQYEWGHFSDLGYEFIATVFQQAIENP